MHLLPNKKVTRQTWMALAILMFGFAAMMGCGGGDLDPSLLADESGAVQAKEKLTFLGLLLKGGWFMIPLIMLSIVVVTIGVERAMTLRRDKIFPTELIDQLSMMSASEGGLDPRRAYAACQSYPSSAAYVMRSALVKVGRPQSEIEHTVSDAAQREATRLSQMSSWLSLAAAVAPLIGLLGTVWGITQAFYDTTLLEDGQNAISGALAEGIYTALVTTLCGLMIAIPSAILAHYYDNRVIQMLNEIEEMIYSLIPQFERYEGQVRFTHGDDTPSTERLDTLDPSGPEDIDTETNGRKRNRASGPRPARNPSD